MCTGPPEAQPVGAADRQPGYGLGNECRIGGEEPGLVEAVEREVFSAGRARCRESVGGAIVRPPELDVADARDVGPRRVRSTRHENDAVALRVPAPDGHQRRPWEGLA